jgi:hypothetical protein
MAVQNTVLPIFRSLLSNLQYFLTKAESQATERGYDVNILMRARLAPDMLSLAGQIRYACISAKAGGARLAAIEVPVYDPIDDSTVAQAQERVKAALAWLDALPADGLEGADGREFDVKVASDGRIHRFTAPQFARHWVLAHFHFHVTMAYAILRHNGVSLGKVDFIWGEKQVA